MMDGFQPLSIIGQNHELAKSYVSKQCYFPDSAKLSESFRHILDLALK